MLPLSVLIWEPLTPALLSWKEATPALLRTLRVTAPLLALLPGTIRESDWLVCLLSAKVLPTPRTLSMPLSVWLDAVMMTPWQGSMRHQLGGHALGRRKRAKHGKSPEISATRVIVPTRQQNFLFWKECLCRQDKGPPAKFSRNGDWLRGNPNVEFRN